MSGPIGECSEDLFARRRLSFDADPDLYARARPGYPEAMFDAIWEFADLHAGDPALEIGCGPGQATLPMAGRGLRVTAIEIGSNMADYVRRAAAHLDVEVHCASFEDCLLPAGRFALVYAGSSFHWVRPEARYVRSAAALRDGGALALFWNRQAQSEGDDPFFDELQQVYAREALGLAGRYDAISRAEQMRAEYVAEIEQSGLFGPVTVQEFQRSISFTAETYAALLSTYSDHATLDPAHLRRLLHAVRELINGSFGGHIAREWATMLFMARKISDPTTGS
ncbi:MAG: class I SAM-dependent methyltransferase [Chthonomonadales bacterium]|nr:class I SAM-dependent methyltransferase [Chthonomonadales bacterium]